MRLAVSAVVLVTLALAPEARADDQPKGRIGVMLKVEDGKVVVVATLDGSPAEKAGIKAGDVFKKVNDYKVKEKAEDEDLAALIKEVVKHEPDTKIKVTVERDGKEKVIEVTVGKPT